MILMRDNVFTKCINALQQVSMMIIINDTMTMMIKVTAREGKPILIIEEGDAETAAWAQHSLEVVQSYSFDDMFLCFQVHDDKHNMLDVWSYL